MLTCPEGGVVRSVNRPIVKKILRIMTLAHNAETIVQTNGNHREGFVFQWRTCMLLNLLPQQTFIFNLFRSFTFDRSPPLSFAGLCHAAPWNPESAEALRCRCSCADYREADGQRVVACANPPSPVLLSGIRVDLSKHSLYALLMHVHVPVATCINHRQPNRNMTAPHAI